MSVSRSSHYTPRSSASHGRIVTQNSSLSAALLRERSNGVVAGSHSTSVDSTALDVVQSDVNVPNVVSNPANNTNVQYVVVSKSRLSLNHASNPDLQLETDEQNSGRHIADTEQVNNTNRTSNLEEEPLIVDASQAQDSNEEHQRYAYHSLKRVSRASSHNAGESFLGSKTATKTSLKGDGVVINKEFGEKTASKSFALISDTNNQSGVGSDENAVSEANNNAHLNSRSSSYAQGKESFAQGNQGTLARNNSSTQQIRADHQHSLDAHQHTRLSLNSQHDRVSRDREPFEVDPAVQSVPPLDLSCFTPDKAPPSDRSDSDSDIPISSQTQLQVQFSDQNLHASDQDNSILHFSAHDSNQTVTGRKTYEVESPLVASQQPHIKSSNNFSGQPDTYRQEREADPQSLQDRVEVTRSDLADDLSVPYPFDTQAGNGNAGSPRPPSPPVQTTPPLQPEPATSLHSKSNSTVYAVANQDILRAQGISPPPGGQYVQSQSRRSDHGEVRFDSASRQPRPETDSRSPVKDRVPTPYARTPPDDSAPNRSSGTRKGSSARSTLPPQHPPLDTKHNTPKPDISRKNSGATVKRVYVESPSFTREEEDEYRFVNSRLDDIDEKNKTYRDMDHKQRGYGGDDMNYSQGYQQGDGRSHRSSNKTMKSNSKQEKNRYEDRNQEQYDRKSRDRYEIDNQERYDDRNRERYDDRNDDRNHERDDDRNHNRYEDRNNEMNGYSDSRYKQKEEDRYEDRDRYGRDYYDQQDRYEHLQNERAMYDGEINREPDPEFNRYQKQNTAVLDEQDLRKEEEYQRDLKKRIDTQQVRDKDSYVNSLRHRDEYEKENFARDSLEYPEEGEVGRRDPRESIGYGNNDQQSPDWENAAQNTYQDNGYSENPQYSQYAGQAYEKQSSKPDFYDAEDVMRMELVNPKQPKYDYVEQNKEDYGMLPRKTYRDLVYKKREEEEKLEHIFITPKVPAKGKKKVQKTWSAQPEHLGHKPPVHDQYPMGFKPSSAEELWAKKAAHLHGKKESAGGSKPQKGSAHASKPPKWNTNAKVNHALTYKPPAPMANQGSMYKPVGMPGSRDQEYTNPARPLQPIENKPAPPTSTELVPTAVQPNSPFRRHMELKPISQEITTEDGQRISVDINLRLISPPPQHSGQISPAQQQMAMVPVQETQGQYQDDANRGIGVPYQMQDPYSGYDIGYNTGYQEQDHTHSIPISDVEQQITAEELALVDPSGYSKKYQSGTPRSGDDANTTDSKANEDGSYAAMYHKNRNKDPGADPWYKVYNLNDYKKMQREIRLNRGTLGPDLDTEPYKEKLEKRHRQFEYARNVMQKNRAELSNKKPPTFPRQPQKPGEDNVKRKAALDYAKNVPKPSVRARPNQYNSYEVSAQLGQGSLKSPSSHSKITPPPTQTVDVIDIRTLEQRHLAEKKNTDKIRQNMDSVLSQKAH